MDKRIIAHLDMDAFFAAIEERDTPRFKGKPIVVGADPRGGAGRGVVSTSNYKAREFGIRSAMPISRAWILAEQARLRGEPETIFLPGNMRWYGQISHEIMEIIRSVSPGIEQVSVDEAFFDLSDAGTFQKAAAIAKKIKEKIVEQQRLTASVGIGPNKLIAKIASDRQKPDGLTIVQSDEVKRFLAPLSIRVLPGVGPKTEKALNQKGIVTIADAQKLTEAQLRDMLGKWGGDLYWRVRGQDDSLLVQEWEAKSIGEQETFDMDTRDTGLVLERLKAMAASVMQSFEKDGFESFKTVVLIVRFEDFQTLTRSHTLPKPANTLKALEQEILRLLLPFFDARENPKRKAFRLVGVRIENLS